MPVPIAIKDRSLLITAVATLFLYACVSNSAVGEELPVDEMCGNGTTFSVDLGTDRLVIPDGCRIYALIVSGYERNSNFDELTLYNLAKFVSRVARIGWAIRTHAVAGMVPRPTDDGWWCCRHSSWTPPR